MKVLYLIAFLCGSCASTNVYSPRLLNYIDVGCQEKQRCLYEASKHCLGSFVVISECQGKNCGWPIRIIARCF